MSNELDAALDFVPVDEGGPQLTSFIGTVLSVEPEVDEKYGGTRIRLVFEDLAEIKARSPYELPICDIAVRIPKVGPRGTASKTNAYAILLESARKVIPELPSWRELKGVRLGLEYASGQRLYNKDKGEYEGNAWVVTQFLGSNGAAPATAMRDVEELALALLNGKTRQKFSIEALKDANIKSSKLASNILNGSWFKELEDAGKVVKGEDGVYSIVG